MQFQLCRACASVFHGARSCLGATQLLNKRVLPAAFQLVSSPYSSPATSDGASVDLERFLQSRWDDSVGREHPNVQRLKNGILRGERAALAAAITLVESRNANKKAQGDNLLAELMFEASRRLKRHGHQSLSFRIAISGSPGVGKSSFIETFGCWLIEKSAKRVAVLTVDPSSHVTGGSILGDITRMAELSKNPNAYVRSSPTAGTLGGVTRGTEESVILCEGAGFNVILIETVGVGQAETAVAEMVDMFILLVSPAHGDELQGIKRGIVEVADLIIVTKADGALLPQARLTQGEYMSALKYNRPRTQFWRPEVLRASSHTKEGIAEVAACVDRFWTSYTASSELTLNRQEQLRSWMWESVRNELLDAFRAHPAVREIAPGLEDDVLSGRLAPGLAAQVLLRKFLGLSVKNDGS